MLQKPLCFLAFGAAVIAATPAAACCECASVCAPVVRVHPQLIYRAEPQPVYVVNRGPVYSGPNIITVPGYVEEDFTPAVYPYVGHNHYRHSYRWRHGLLYPPLRRWHGHHPGFFYK